MACGPLQLLSPSQLPPAVVSFDWVTVGNPGNLPDTLAMSKGPTADNTSGYGSVGYAYQIAITHVTNLQYVEFLNAVDPTETKDIPSWEIAMESTTQICRRARLGGGSGRSFTGGIDYSLLGSLGNKYAVKSGQGKLPGDLDQFGLVVRVRELVTQWPRLR